MQTKSNKGKTRGISQKPLQADRIGIANRSGKAGRGRVLKGKATGTNKPVTPFTLKPTNKIHFGLQVKVLQGGDDNYSSPAEQLKMIENLYPIISNIPGFVGNTSFNSDTTPAEVLHCLLHEFERITGSEEWKIGKADNGNYILFGYEEHGSTDAQWIPINFLAKISHSHPKLHELLIYSFMLASKINGIWLPYDSVKLTEKGGCGMNYEYMMERAADYGDLKEFENALAYYGPKGLVSSYLRFMQGPASYKIWKNELERFKPSNPFEIASHDFLKAADQMFQTKMSLRDYCENEYNEGIMPTEYMQMVWSDNPEDDHMTEIHFEVVDDFANNYGVHPFRWKSNYSDPGSNKKIRDFIDLVKNFFHEGMLMANWMEKNLENESEHLLPTKKKKQNKNVYLINQNL